MIERFLKEKDLLTEIWSPFVKGSEDGAKSLVIGDLIKKTDKFELYKATNLSGSLNFDIIVYLDDNVKPEGQCLLGQVKRSDYYSYEESKQLSCVFEIKGN